LLKNIKDNIKIIKRGMSVNIRRSPGYQIADRPTSPLASPRTHKEIKKENKGKKSHRTKSGEDKDPNKERGDRKLRSKSSSPRNTKPISLSASPLRQSGYSSAELISEPSHTDRSSDSSTSIDTAIRIIMEWKDSQGYKHRIPYNVWVEQYKSTLPDFQNNCAWCQKKYNDNVSFSCECHSYIFCQMECYGNFTKAMDHECQTHSN
jgi:hypothetical protein